MHSRILQNFSAMTGVYIEKDSPMLWHEPHPEEAQLARSLQRMWSQCNCEANPVRTLLCWLGLHLWLQPDYTAFTRRNSIRFCPACASVQINGRIYR